MFEDVVVDPAVSFSPPLPEKAKRTVVAGHLEVFSALFRFVWPSGLDRMARLAGMTLRERWGSWTREPFTSGSTSHISVCQEPTERADHAG
jgi:hypothetical protein